VFVIQNLDVIYQDVFGFGAIRTTHIPYIL